MLHQTYDPALVFTSILVASIAGFAALDLSARVSVAAGWSRVRWIGASAIAMGVGIWSMHFIAMLALRIDVPVVYDIPLLALSVIIAISASAITFTGAAAKRATNARLALASLAMGPAIAGMHYTGMAAMRMPARIDYHAGLVALSVGIAISASYAALVLARHFRLPAAGRLLPKIAAAGIMGAAVYGMHYTGMLAARFVAAPEIQASTTGMLATHGLAWTIAVGALVVMTLAVLAGVADRRIVAARHVADEAVHQRVRVIETLHQIGQLLASELELQRVVQTVTDAGTELTGAQFGAIFYNAENAAGESRSLFTVSGVPAERLSGFPLPRNTEVIAPTSFSEETVRSDDITRDPRFRHMEPHLGAPGGHAPVRSYLAVPVISRSGAVLGGLVFGHERPRVFEKPQELLAEGIASWAAVAMDNARLFEAEQRARAEAERASRAKSDFLAVMSHELRTPLNAIIGYADLLLAGIPDPVPDGAVAKLQRITFSAGHLLQLIDEILTFSRLEAGEEKVHAQAMDAVELLAEVHALMEPLALKKGITLQSCSPSTPVPLHSDTRKLRQILLNLVTNAVKFTDGGTVCLGLEPSDGEVVFTIRDTGPGIAPEHREKIFEAFWQADGSHARGSGGTGLGLSVSHRLAKLLGGDLYLDSAERAGSTFVLRLPRTPEGESSPLQPGAIAAPSRVSG